MADLHVMLLAGGSGTRFWPSSRIGLPKQFLPLAGPRPMIDETWRRIRPLAPPRRLWAIAPERLAADVRAYLPKLREENLVLEPSPRDTAPAIALACERLYRRESNAIAAIFPIHGSAFSMLISTQFAAFLVDAAFVVAHFFAISALQFPGTFL